MKTRSSPNESLTGQRFGRLLVADQITSAANGCRRFRCICDCGNTTECKATSLKAGDTNSCGCLRKEGRTTHNMTGTFDTPATGLPFVQPVAAGNVLVELERFARLTQQTTAEECAQLCRDNHVTYPLNYATLEPYSWSEGGMHDGVAYAKAIRAKFSD